MKPTNLLEFEKVGKYFHVFIRCFEFGDIEKIKKYKQFKATAWQRKGIIHKVRILEGGERWSSKKRAGPLVGRGSAVSVRTP